MSYLSGMKTEAQKYHEANAMQAMEEKTELPQLYHMSCQSCGKDWWDKKAFPMYCPYCNTNRMPERKDGDDNG